MLPKWLLRAVLPPSRLGLILCSKVDERRHKYRSGEGLLRQGKSPPGDTRGRGLYLSTPLSSPLQIHDKVIMEAANRWRLLHHANALSRPLFNEVGRCPKGSPKLTKDNFPTARLRSPSTTF